MLGIRDAVQGKGQEICLCLEFTQVSLATCLDLFLPRCMWVSSKSPVKWESRALAGSSFPSAGAKSFVLKSKAFSTSSFLPPPHGHSSGSLHCASMDHQGLSRNLGLCGAGGAGGGGGRRQSLLLMASFLHVLVCDVCEMVLCDKRGETLTNSHLLCPSFRFAFLYSPLT